MAAVGFMFVLMGAATLLVAGAGKKWSQDEAVGQRLRGERPFDLGKPLSKERLEKAVFEENVVLARSRKPFAILGFGLVSLGVALIVVGVLMRLGS